MKKTRSSIAWDKALLLLLSALPLAQLVTQFFREQLGSNPIETITHSTGDWALRFLLLTLLVSPLRKALKRPALIRYRRMLGLIAFAYGSLHLTTWLWLDQGWDLHDMWDDVVKRRFVTAGALAFALMIPLAVTSTAGWIRRLGGKRWRRLHQLVYVSAIAGVIHYVWLVKSDLRAPVAYGLVLLVLLASRLAIRFSGAR
jgi:methionine sulfoxide reductase heme-binding subunit